MNRKTWLKLGMGAMAAIGIAVAARHCRRMMAQMGRAGEGIDLDHCGPAAGCCSDEQAEDTAPLAA